MLGWLKLEGRTMIAIVISRPVVTAFSLLIVALAFTTFAHAKEQVRWKAQSAFATTLDVPGEGGLKFSEDLRVMSAGTFRIRIYEPGALVPAGEVFSAVAAGSIEAGWTTPGYHVGKIPSAVLFASVPFGPLASEFLAWLKFGGGNALKNDIYGRYGVNGINCAIFPPEASGWYRNEIRTIADLKGLRLRSSGLGAKVLRKLGVSTQLLAPAWASLKRRKRYIYDALSSGDIDGAEFSYPSTDVQFGLHKIAKHYYFPGWHNQSAVGEFLVNSQRYQALSDTHRRMIEVACDAIITWSLSAGESRQFAVMRTMTTDHGVKLHFWSDAIIARLRQAWEDVVREESVKDADFKKVYESYSSFRKQYAIWRDHAYVK